MDWKKQSPEQKVKFLEGQLTEIERTRKLLNRWEALTKSWLANVQKKVGGEHTK